MKALTLWQPWASLMALGAKTYETRSWSTEYRGLLAIHAAQTDVGFAVFDVPIFRTLCFDAGLPAADRLPLGVVVCTVNVLEVYRTQDILPTLPAWGMERAFGNWAPGRYAWKTELVQVFDDPIPAKGMQGLWEWHHE